ncbi:hypothetical protein [Pseudobacillus wudalianchiensis]|uniref:Sodium:glutamate symporter n=1 Tax=Pseudobacillus wudalianchiensis TaxID=1743143 RepID=A0A1B9AAF7_9BACI|nr:hypothetical protein [Bacillus wudalianchiensis]OCA80824.1 hypothetical protein A8F95_17090 [Bacillus wudalianchiensis]
MLKDPVIATMIILSLIVVGEIVSIKTRARVPMLAIALFGYLVLIWVGVFPEDLLDHSTLATLGALMFAPLVVHMGTLIPMKMIKQQYKSVIIALIGIVISTGTILLVVTPIFGYKIAASGVGPISGGVVAFIITSDKLHELGLASLVTVPAVVLGLQTLVGLPLASFFLRRYAKKLSANFDQEKYLVATSDAAFVSGEIDQEETKVKGKQWLPDKYATAPILIFQLFIGGSLAVILNKATGINYALWALVIGLVGTYVGFYRQSMLEKSNSFGIVMLAIVFAIIQSMNGVTFDMLLEYFPAVMMILAIGAIGIILGGFIGSKLVRWDMDKGVPVALTAMFGFPGDYLVCEEVSRSIGKTKEEEEYIFNEILSPMLVGGFTTVTTASIVIAGVVMSTL